MKDRPRQQNTPANNESEQRAIARINAYLAAGHGLEEIRQAGWEEWIDYLEAEGYDLPTGEKLISPPDAALSSTAYNSSESVSSLDVPKEAETASSDAAATEDSKSFWGFIRFWFRWVAVLPAGVIAIIAVSFPVHWVVMIFTAFNETDEDSVSLSLWSLPPESLERMGQAFFAPVVLLLIATKVAPAFKLHTGAILAVVYTMGIGAALTYTGTSGFYEEWGWLEFGAVGILATAGVLVGAFSSYAAVESESM